MEEYREIITALVVAILIPSFYMIAYVLKGKEKGVLAFFKTLACTIEMYVSSLIPIMLFVVAFTRMDSSDMVGMLILDVCAIVFSAPFFSSLIKRISNDFEVPFGFESHFLTIIFFVVAIIFVGGATIGFGIGYMSGEVSIFAVIGLLFMLVAIIIMMVVTKMKADAACDVERIEEIKKIERKIGLALGAAMFVYFIALMIFGV